MFFLLFCSVVVCFFFDARCHADSFCYFSKEHVIYSFSHSLENCCVVRARAALAFLIQFKNNLIAIKFSIYRKILFTRAILLLSLSVFFINFSLKFFIFLYFLVQWILRNIISNESPLCERKHRFNHFGIEASRECGECFMCRLLLLIFNFHMQ